MIHLLIIGRHAATLAGRLGAQSEPQALELRCARLPAEGIRQLEHSPPDALVVLDDAHGARARALVHAIRQRPIGPLLPILVLSAVPTGADAHAMAQELGVDHLLAPDAKAQEVLEAVAAMLGLERAQLAGPPQGARSQEHPDFLVEEILEDDPSQTIPPPLPPEKAPSHPEPPAPASTPGPLAGEPVGYEPPVHPVERIHRQSLFPVKRRPAAAQDQVTEEVIRRKLAQVRHDDYFAILEARLGSEGAVLRQAYQRLMARFDPEHMEFGLAHKFYPELEEIRDAFEDAWAVLGEAHLRQRYIEAHMGRSDRFGDR